MELGIDKGSSARHQIGYMLPQKNEEVDIVANICRVLAKQQTVNAAELLGAYVFRKMTITRSSVTPATAVRVFVRDGFLDRYSGQRLIFPPVLRIISARLGQEHFPFHPNWKTECTHPAFWELGATVDHMAPITGGGKEDLDNYRTTSMTWNAVKSNCTLAELGWEEQQAGDVRQWDGLLAWFLEYVRDHEEMRRIELVRRWHTAVFAAGEVDERVAEFLKENCPAVPELAQSRQ